MAGKKYIWAILLVGLVGCNENPNIATHEEFRAEREESMEVDERIYFCNNRNPNIAAGVLKDKETGREYVYISNSQGIAITTRLEKQQ